MVTQPSSKTSYVVVGADAGPSKLAAIKKHGLPTLDEDGFLNLIATRVLDGNDEKLKKKLEKEQEAIKQAAKEMEREEKKAAKDHTMYDIKFMLLAVRWLMLLQNCPPLKSTLA